jgi:hypothetical protein
MNNRIFTILAVFAMLIAAVIAAFNLMLSAYIIAGVLIFGVGLLIYRIKFGQ